MKIYFPGLIFTQNKSIHIKCCYIFFLGEERVKSFVHWYKIPADTSRVVLTPNEISYEVEMFFFEDMEFISSASKMG